MTPDSFDRDILNAPETKENRIIRAQLRLSNHWIVTGKTFFTQDRDYSDEHPHIPETCKREDLGREQDESIVTIHVAARPERHPRCPVCGSCDCRVICYESRTLRHIDDLGSKCFVRVRLPKYKCGSCGGTPQKRFPLAHDRLSYTRPFAREVMTVLKSSSRSATAAKLHTTVDIVNGVLERTIRDAVINQDLSHVTGVYLDETQFGSGQDYVSVFADQDHNVIFACHGHKADVLEIFRDHLVVQGGDPESVRFFSTDMSAAYESGIQALFPNATLVWDRFHLAKSVNDALNDVRKRTLKRKDGEPLRSAKYVVLRRRTNMERRHLDRLRRIELHCPELALAFDMKEAFLEIIKVPDLASMRRSILAWADWVERYGPRELVQKARRFREKIDRIVAWTAYPVSNSVSEGINKNIQDIRRQACGYTNLDHFFDMILFRQGNLTLRF